MCQREFGAPKKLRARIRKNHTRVALGDHIVDRDDGRHRTNQWEVGIHGRKEKSIEAVPRDRPRHAQQIDDAAPSCSRRSFAGCLV